MSFARRERWVQLAAFAAAGLIVAGCKEGESPTARSAGKDSVADAAEHPVGGGRPAGSSSVKEHPAGAAAAGITKDSLADAIEAWVGKQGGTLKVKDDKTGETLSLSLVKVHRERIAHLGEDTCFVCADFKTAAGKVYDLDVFVKGTALDNLKFYDLTIHKEEGKARYTWHKEGGVWKKMPMIAAGSGSKRERPKKASEHPVEHPK